MVARWSRQAWVLISPDPRLRRNDLGIAGIRMVERNPGLKLSAPDRIRTCDLRFRRPTLYPAELRARVRGGAPDGRL